MTVTRENPSLTRGATSLFDSFSMTSAGTTAIPAAIPPDALARLERRKIPPRCRQSNGGPVRNRAAARTASDSSHPHKSPGALTPAGASTSPAARGRHEHECPGYLRRRPASREARRSIGAAAVPRWTSERAGTSTQVAICPPLAIPSAATILGPARYRQAD